MRLVLIVYLKRIGLKKGTAIFKSLRRHFGAGNVNNGFYLLSLFEFLKIFGVVI